MKELIFEWDDTKNETNQTKHGVSFEEAQTVFFDERAIQFDDPDHSTDEERFLLLGFSQNTPGWRLPSLKGDRLGLWAIDVNKNWRILFEFKDAYIVDYEDYH